MFTVALTSTSTNFAKKLMQNCSNRDDLENSVNRPDISS